MLCCPEFLLRSVRGYRSQQHKTRRTVARFIPAYGLLRFNVYVWVCVRVGVFVCVFSIQLIPTNSRTMDFYRSTALLLKHCTDNDDNDDISGHRCWIRSCAIIALLGDSVDGRLEDMCRNVYEYVFVCI